MKLFEMPNIEIVEFQTLDVITTSDCSSDCSMYDPNCITDMSFA